MNRADNIACLADRAAAAALPRSAAGIAALERALLGRPEFAPWDAAALKPVFFDLARSLRPSGGFAPARFFLAEAGARGSSGAGLHIAGALELGAVSHVAIRRYILLSPEHTKFKPRAILLMLASLTAYGIASGLLDRAFRAKRSLRGPVLRRFTTEMNRYYLRLGRLESAPAERRAAGLRDASRPDSAASCLLRLSAFLAGSLAGRRAADIARLELTALTIARRGAAGGPLPDEF